MAISQDLKTKLAHMLGDSAAEELWSLLDITAGTLTASKALVPSSTGVLNVLNITTLSSPTQLVDTMSEYTASNSINATSRMTGTDGVASGTARVIGGRARSVAGTAIHDSSTETVSASYTIPANTLKAGSVVKIKGRITTPTTVGADTLTFFLRFGATTLVGTALITSAATNATDADQAVFEYNLFATAAPGGTAAVLGFGQFTELAGTTWKLATLASTNFATNGALLIEATLKWSTTNANTGSVDWFTVEIT